MNYCVLRNFRWGYPHVKCYKDALKKAEFSALVGGYGAFQVILTDCVGKITVNCPEAEIYEEISVNVESNAGLEESIPHFPEMKAPFRVYDCLRPYGGEITPENGAAAVYFAFPIKKSISGNIEICDEKTAVSVPYSFTAKGKVPEETLKILMNFSAPTAKATDRIYDEDAYLKLLRRMRQNRLYINIPIWKTENIEKTIESFDGYIEKALEAGFTHFHISGVGFRRSWKASEILIAGKDFNSPEGKEFLAYYLSCLRNHIKAKGWLQAGIFSIGLADEPNEYNAETYKELSLFVRKHFPEITLYDAVSAIDIKGALDIWVPRSDDYEKHRDIFEKRRSEGGEIWQYVCLYPRCGGYINRFLDISLLSTRYIFWGNYLYNLSGYLHWTVNDYQGEESPYESSCPVHYNADSVSILPPGDDKLIYPNAEMSIRLENHRESAEEYEMLRIIAAHDKDTADRICKSCLRSFTDAEYDIDTFARVREELIEEYSRITSESRNPSLS